MQIHLLRPWRLTISVVIVMAAAFALMAGGDIEAPPDPLAMTPLATTDGDAGEDAGDVAGTATAAAPKEGDIRGHSRILIVTYYVKENCTVRANYPGNPGNHTWQIKKGTKIGWRYNADDRVSAISDPAVNGFPHWGFVERSCIGESTGQDPHGYEVYHDGTWVKKKTPPMPAGVPVPTRVRSGRSQHTPYWRVVDWNHDYGTVPAAHRVLGHDRTLRDTPLGFVIGNVFGEWQIRPTDVHRNGYTRVYVPSLHRWGWLQL